jgi:putative transposase
MARAHRIQLAEAVYNVGSRGNGRRTLFHDSVAYEVFLELLSASVRRFGWLCHTYCLMPNHFHLLVETTEPNISAGMNWLKTRYAQWFNMRSRQSGHVFQGRFFGELVEADAHFLELLRYFMNNPVRAGLCADAGGWRWSSYRAVAGEARQPTFLTTRRVLAQFDRDPAEAREEFKRFVLGAPLQPLALDNRGQTPGSDPGWTLGSTEAVDAREAARQ